VHAVQWMQPGRPLAPASDAPPFPEMLTGDKRTSSFAQTVMTLNSPVSDHVSVHLCYQSINIRQVLRGLGISKQVLSGTAYRSNPESSSLIIQWQLHFSRSSTCLKIVLFVLL
jgi:hypothetical protein